MGALKTPSVLLHNLLLGVLLALGIVAQASGQQISGYEYRFYFFYNNTHDQLFCARGSTVSNLVVNFTPILWDVPGSGIRDPSVIYYGGRYILVWNQVLAGGFESSGVGFATSPDGLTWTISGHVDVAAMVGDGRSEDWAPEWFVDPTNGLHMLIYLPPVGDAYETATFIADINPENITNVTNLRQIQNTSSSDPYMIYSNGIYYLFTSEQEYTSTNIDSDFVANPNVSANGAEEGSVVINVDGQWWWIKTNTFGDDQYDISTDLMDWFSGWQIYPYPRPHYSDGSPAQQGDLALYPVITMPPVISGFAPTATNVVLNGVYGTPETNCVVLTATSLAAPMSSWTPVATNQFNAAGQVSFTFTNPFSPIQPAAFYRLQYQ